MKIKHSKYKNSGILFELLVRQITSDTLEGKDSPIKEILKKYFVKTELGKEYKLYETLLNKTSITEARADLIVTSLIESSKNLNRRIIKQQKYNLISEVQKHYNLNEFFNHKLPHYKVHAAFFTLLEIYNSPKVTNPEYIIDNKMTILEHLTAAKIKEEEVRDNVINEFKKEDKDIRILTYKILLEKFNQKYSDLLPEQKIILKEFITSVNSTTRLRNLINKEIKNISSQVNEMLSSIDNNVVKIKLEEVAKNIQPISKRQKIVDGHLVKLMQYYDLVNELKSYESK